MRIGIDLGGTKIEAAALDASGDIIHRVRVATPHAYGATIDAIAALVEDVERSVGQRGSVGVGIPGAVTPAGVIKNANSVWLIGQPMGADLARRLGRDVRLANDANCFAISEATDGAAAGAAVVFGAILGTGVGGGVVVRGRVLDGANLIAGEWGHNQLPWMTDDERPGAECYCGKRGCIETFLSGPGFERDARSATGLDRTSPEILASAVGHDAGAVAAVERYHDRLARSLAGVINILDPDVIVLGGGMSNAPGLADAAGVRLPRYVFSDSVVTRVVKNAHGDSSGVRGAAWLWSPVGGRRSAVGTDDS
jgi:fructokinase